MLALSKGLIGRSLQELKKLNSVSTVTGSLLRGTKVFCLIYLIIEAVVHEAY